MYEEITLKDLGKPLRFTKKLYYIIFMGFLSTFILLVIFYNSITITNFNLLVSTITISIALLFIFLLGMYFLIFIMVIDNFYHGSNYNPFRIFTLSDKKSILSLVIGFSIFLILGLNGVFNSFITLQDMILGLFILIPFIMIALLEGKFFTTFAIQNWYLMVNWDFLKGISIQKKGQHIVERLKGFIIRCFAVIALLTITISLISLGINLIDLIGVSHFRPTISYLPPFVKGIPGPISIYILIIGLGPFLTLLIKPLNYTDIWIHQGLYNQIGSDWTNIYLSENPNNYINYQTTIR